MDLLRYFKELENRNLMIPLDEEDEFEMVLFSLNDNNNNDLESELIFIESKVILNEVNRTINLI